MGVTYGRKGITRIWDMKSISPVLSRNIKSVYTRLSSFHRMLPGKRIYNNCRIFIPEKSMLEIDHIITCYVSIWTCGTFELAKEFTSLLYHERGTYILEFHRRDKRVVCRLISTCKISAKYIQVIGICLCLCSYLYCLHVSAYMVSLVQTYLHGEKLMK